jgi:hypothetical protein
MSMPPTLSDLLGSRKTVSCFDCGEPCVVPGALESVFMPARDVCTFDMSIVQAWPPRSIRRIVCYDCYSKDKSYASYLGIGTSPRIVARKSPMETNTTCKQCYADYSGLNGYCSAVCAVNDGVDRNDISDWYMDFYTLNSINFHDLHNIAMLRISEVYPIRDMSDSYDSVLVRVSVGNGISRQFAIPDKLAANVPSVYLKEMIDIMTDCNLSWDEVFSVIP